MPESERVGTAPVDPAAEVPPPPEGGSLIDASAELVEAAVQYVRQEVGDLVEEKVAGPVKRAGVSAGLAVAVGTLVALGLGFVSVGVLLVLAGLLGWPGALFLIGGLLIAGSVALVVIRSRRMKP